MLRWLGQLALSLFAFSVPVTVSLPRTPTIVRPTPPAPTRAAAATLPTLEATASAVVDVRTGAVLFEHAARRPLPLASITKLMTALVVADRSPDWDQVVTMQEADQRSGGVVLLAPGEQISVRDLFAVMLVASSNEAAVALSRSTGLSQPAFVAAMNHQADALGLASLQFVDAAGLEAGNVGNARDVAQLGRNVLGNPAIAEAMVEPALTFTIRNTGERRTAIATNRLFELTPANAGLTLRGGKTGYLEEVGYNFVSLVDQAGNTISVALLGANSADGRWQESLGLSRWIFASYQWPKLGG